MGIGRPRTRLAIFDIDGTLAEGLLADPLPGHLRQAGLGSLEGHQLLQDYLASLGPDGLEDTQAAQHAYELYAAMLAGTAVGAVRSVIDELWQLRRAVLFPFARPLLAELSERGYTPVLLSVGPRELVQRVATHLFVSRAWGTSLEELNGVYTGRIAVTVAGRKPDVIRAAFDTFSVSWAESVAVGNSAADTGLLSLVGRPIAFEPTAALRRRADACSWPLADRTTLSEALTSRRYR